MQQRAEAEVSRIKAVLEPTVVAAAVRDRVKRLQKMLADDTDEWKTVVPGKVLLAKFASIAGIDVGRLKTLYVRQVEQAGTNTFAEITEIFSRFSQTGSKGDPPQDPVQGS